MSQSGRPIYYNCFFTLKRKPIATLGFWGEVENVVVLSGAGGAGLWGVANGSHFDTGKGKEKRERWDDRKLLRKPGGYG